jgi:hypothetical protein
MPAGDATSHQTIERGQALFEVARVQIRTADRNALQ